jgi:hypothetical protein
MARTVPGSGAVIEPIFNSIYGVKDIVVIDGGEGYDPDNPPRLTISNCGTPLREAILRPVINKTDGKIQAVEVIDPGEGYLPLEVIVEPLVQNATKVKARAVLNPSGSISYIQVFENGDGYFGSNSARAYIRGGGGSGVQLVPITGLVTGLSLENPGQNYELGDVTIVISGGGGQGAAGVANVDEFGVVTDINISNAGEFFETPPLIQLIGGGGSGAQAKASIDLGSLTDITVTNPGGGFINPPQVIFTRDTNLIKTTRNRQSLNAILYNLTGITKDISPSQNFIDVETTDPYPGSGKILLGREIIRYTGKTSTQFTGCDRGVNFKFDQKVILDDLANDPETGISNYNFNVADKIIREVESSNNKVAKVYDWDPINRALYIIFEVDELAFIDGGRSGEKSAVISFTGGTANSSATGVAPHTVVEKENSRIFLFTSPITILPNSAFLDINLNGQPDGIADLINATTEYENKINLDGGISTSLYGIEETVGGQSTTLFQQGDKIFDSSSSKLLASVSSAGQLNDGDSYEAILEFKIRNISTISYVIGETVIGGTSTVSAEVVSFNRTTSILTLKSPVEYNGNHLFSVGESLVGNSSGATATLVQRSYPVYARNEEE